MDGREERPGAGGLGLAKEKGREGFVGKGPLSGLCISMGGTWVLIERGTEGLWFLLTVFSDTALVGIMNTWR